MNLLVKYLKPSPSICLSNRSIKVSIMLPQVKIGLTIKFFRYPQRAPKL